MSVDEVGWTVAETPGILWNLWLVYTEWLFYVATQAFTKSVWIVQLPLPIPNTDATQCTGSPTCRLLLCSMALLQPRLSQNL